MKKENYENKKIEIKKEDELNDDKEWYKSLCYYEKDIKENEFETLEIDLDAIDMKEFEEEFWEYKK